MGIRELTRSEWSDSSVTGEDRYDWLHGSAKNLGLFRFEVSNMVYKMNVMA